MIELSAQKFNYQSHKNNMDTNTEEKKCVMCGGGTTGYKCDVCGEEAGQHESSHACGGDHCVAKCAGCSEAETKCTCA